MTPDAIRAAVNERQALICTIYGEAADQGLIGQVAVGCVVRNRVLKPGWWGKDFRSVCLAPSQFSCWWEANDNTKRVYDLADALLTATDTHDAIVRQIAWIADGVLSEAARDVTGGATQYLTSALFRSNPPSWARGRAFITIGGHLFLQP